MEQFLRHELDSAASVLHTLRGVLSVEIIIIMSPSLPVLPVLPQTFRPSLARILLALFAIWLVILMLFLPWYFPLDIDKSL